MTILNDWKQLERHPLSAEYKDIEGQPWQDLLDRLTVMGSLPDRPIVLFEGKVLDGWQRQRACVKLGVEPTYDNLRDGMDAEMFVQAVNDIRRHESAEEAAERVARRRERLRAARAQGQSIRSIAKAESISKSQVERDLQASVVPGGTPETVKGTDGKTYKARKPREWHLCGRCERVGSPSCEPC
jgi:hypothetical protein